MSSDHLQCLAVSQIAYLLKSRNLQSLAVKSQKIVENCPYIVREL